MKRSLLRQCIIAAICIVFTSKSQALYGYSSFLKSEFVIPHTTILNSTNAIPTFATGDVFASVGNGKVNWYHSNGSMVSTLDTGIRGIFTTGMAFDTLGNLYVTTFDGGTVKKFDKSGNLLGIFGENYSGAPESIVFDSAGNVYVGAVNGDNDIRKFDANGKLIAQYNVAIEDRGSDWIDLSRDQCTMFYTSEGNAIKRFNVCTNSQLANFTTILHGRAYALRILPDGGVLVADSVDIHLLNAAGQIIKTYDAPGEEQWFALNLDPDGTSFWSGDSATGHLYRFDIASGQIQLGPLSTCGANCLYGVTIYRENVISSIRFRLPFALESSTSRIDGTDRINSYFDHEYPLQRPDLGGSEPQTKGISDTIVIYTGSEYPGAWTGINTTNGRWYSGHDGYDFRGKEGETAVYAAHDGNAVGTTVACTKNISINAVKITQGRYQTLYLHLYDDKFYQDLVTNPRDVKAGERIGTFGNSGKPTCSTGAHLHFATYYDVNSDDKFERNEKIDPYGFNSTQQDPWTLAPYNGPSSSWLWEFNQTAETTLLPGNTFALASGNMRVEVPTNGVNSQAFVTLMAVPDPQLVLNNKIKLQHITTVASSLGIGSSFQLTGVYADSNPVTTFAAPVTLRMAYGDQDISSVNQTTLAIYNWEEAAQNWVPMPTTIDTVAKTVVTKSSTPALFSLRAQPLNAAPQLISIVPTSINSNSSTTISVIGNNFIATPWLEIGTTALNVTYVSPSQLSAYIPAGIAPGVYTLILRNPDGQITALPDGLLIKDANLNPGDCNADHVITASDVTALALEFFDGDDNGNPLGSSGGTYAGSAACDANEDSRIGASDVTCIARLFFNGPGACRTTVATASAVHPTLALPTQIPATAGGQVTVPITLNSHGAAVGSLLFSLDYDETWLHFDPTDSDGNGLPDAITAALPAEFAHTVTFDPADTDGELDFVVSSFAATPLALTDGPLLTVTFQVGQPPTDTAAALRFAQSPGAAFGDAQGQELAGDSVDGAVSIILSPGTPTAKSFTYLPLITHTP